MTNISAMRTLAELNKLEETRNSANTQPAAENKPKFSMFGFGFTSSVNPEDEIPPEEKGFHQKI